MIESVIIMAARTEVYESNRTIVEEGTMKHRMYVVLKGEVILYSNYGTEDEYIVGMCKKGKSFGEFNLFTDEAYPFTAIAYGDTQVTWFEKSNLDSFLFGHPELAMNMMERISHSYDNMARNLHRAIDEINVLKQACYETSADENKDESVEKKTEE